MARQSLRAQIVDAAAERFHTHGYNAAGVKDITDAAGVPKGSFYNHFESKEALAVTILDLYGQTRRLEDLADESVAPLTRLRSHFEFLRAEQEGFEYSRGCLLGNFGAEISDHSEVLRRQVQQGFTCWRDALAGALADAVRLGEVDQSLDPQTTALFVMTAWEGALLAARTSRSGASFDAFFSNVFERLLRPSAAS
ncbi:TetR/AcrR family transcriptional regulator [Catenulispora rubra]|uniref:TetR/AcrR family transcriptional regulator n=1 Tax=Catenulispora rubra TaxID=280293 RepID=UPI001891F9FB|nr:TetR/AcrR family transcriptional regulator [Catenulispora rubra]